MLSNQALRPSFDTRNGFFVSELDRNSREKLAGLIVRTYIKLISPGGRGILAAIKRRRLANYAVRMLEDNLRTPSFSEISFMYELFTPHGEEPQLVDLEWRFPEDETTQEHFIVLPPEEFSKLKLKPLPLRESRLPMLEKLESLGDIKRYYAPELRVYSFYEVFPGRNRPEHIPIYSTDLSDIVNPMCDMMINELLPCKRDAPESPRSPRSPRTPEAPIKRRRNSI